MYAVLHGGVDRELRQLSIDYLTQLPFDGFAIGSSTSVGSSCALLKKAFTYSLCVVCGVRVSCVSCAVRVPCVVSCCMRCAHVVPHTKRRQCWA
jgi:hypothetical protein